MKAALIWTPRLIMLVYTGFIASFALDAFGEAGTWLGKALDFILHLIPAAVTAFFLVIAWRFRIIGGLLLMVLGMVFTIYFGTGRSVPHFLLVSFPLVFSGVLFIFSNWNEPAGHVH